MAENNSKKMNTDLDDVDNLDIDNLDVKRKTLSNDVVDKIKFKFRSTNQIELINADIRNILFCGASRSGKSTCFGVFKDPCFCPSKTTMFSETQDTIFKTYSLRNNKTKDVHGFVLSLIDSPGTFEIRSTKDEFKKRSNEEIGKLIVECLNHEVTYLNLIAMFLTISGRVGDKDIESIKLFMEMFGSSGMPIILCVTHADEYNDVKMDKIREEIQIHPDLEQYFIEKKLKIVFMGCVDHKHQDYSEVETIAQTYKKVLTWRNEFLDIIFAATEKYDLKTTKIYGDRKQSIIECLKLCMEELNYLKSCDIDTAEFKRRIVLHNENMKYLYKNKLLITDDEVSSRKFDEFWELIQSVKSLKIEDIVKAELIKPWRL